MLRPLLPLMFAAAASYLTLSAPSWACDLVCPAGKVCSVEPTDCSSPGCQPGEPCGGGPVCSGQMEVCAPAPCTQASDCPAGWACDDPDATCSMDSSGNTHCESSGHKVCLEPPGQHGRDPHVPVDEPGHGPGDAATKASAEEKAGTEGCSMGAGSSAGSPFSLLALLGISVLAVRRRR